MRLVDAPAADGVLVDRLAHLGGARGPHRPFGAVEREAAVVPGQAAMGDEAPRLENRPLRSPGRQGAGQRGFRLVIALSPRFSQ